MFNNCLFFRADSPFFDQKVCKQAYKLLFYADGRPKLKLEQKNINVIVFEICRRGRWRYGGLEAEPPTLENLLFFWQK